MLLKIVYFQCRIKVFGGPRLDTIMGPTAIFPPMVLYPHHNSGVSPPENVKLQMTAGIRVLLVELNV